MPEPRPPALDRPLACLRGLCTPRRAAFVLRSSAAATLSYLIAQRVGLPFPVWAAISATIVSQERYRDTRFNLLARTAGTVIGMVAAVAVHELVARLGGIGVPAQIAIGTALCALVALAAPALRVCMRTFLIVLLGAQPALPLRQVALYRGGEVLIGALLTTLLHWVSEPRRRVRR